MESFAGLTIGDFLAPAIFLVLLVFFVRNPDWLNKRLSTLLRGKGTSDPFYPWRRWDWRVLPAEWKSRLRLAVVWAIVFAAFIPLLIWRSAERISWGLLFIPAFLAVHFLIMAARVVVKALASGRE